MPKSQDKLTETETYIRWDESEPVATLYTASPSVRKEWESFGFPVQTWTAINSPAGWFCRVPKDRITYKTYQKV